MAIARHFLITIVLLSLFGLIAGCGSDAVAPNSDSQEAPLLPPQSMVAARSNGDILLSWEPNTQSNLLGYNVYRSVYLKNQYVKLNTSVITGTQFIDSTAQSNVLYTYQVRCVSIKGTEGGIKSISIYNGITNTQPKGKKFIES